MHFETCSIRDESMNVTLPAKSEVEVGAFWAVCGVEYL